MLNECSFSLLYKEISDTKIQNYIEMRKTFHKDVPNIIPLFTYSGDYFNVKNNIFALYFSHSAFLFMEFLLEKYN